MQIALVDDELGMRNELSLYVERYGTENGIGMKIRTLVLGTTEGHVKIDVSQILYVEVSEKLGIRDGSFSHFSFYEKWEKEPSPIPSFRFARSGKGTVPDSQFPTVIHVVP